MYIVGHLYSLHEGSETIRQLSVKEVRVCVACANNCTCMHYTVKPVLVHLKNPQIIPHVRFLYCNLMNIHRSETESFSFATI